MKNGDRCRKISIPFEMARLYVKYLIYWLIAATAKRIPERNLEIQQER